MSSKTENTVENIKFEAIETARNAKYCLNCKMCYRRIGDEWGLCRHSNANKPLGVTTPLIVSEFYSCEEWQPLDWEI